MKKGMKKLLSSVIAVTMLFGTLAVPSKKADAAGETLLNTYGSAFGYVGTCINLSQLRNANTLSHVKSQYNSITLENEMKPDALLGYSANLISKEEAKRNGYYIPSGMTESYVPKINFSTVDEVLKICYENGLKMRAHTLVWHSQTPDWFFRSSYNGNSAYVSQAQMDLRMEYYIKSVMNHVYNGQYGSVVYAWDVVNEYMHATNCGWLSIYGNVNNNPSFVKKAFQYAHECLSSLGLADSVDLFYNDYNTYMEVNNIITMIRFINREGKICDGVGMQSHLNTDYPSVSYYMDAVKAFLNAGFEVQITELDVVNKGDTDQADYLYQIMSQLLALKKNGANITGITIWGISDDVTWIRGEKPLLFSSLGNPKSAYYRMIEAYQNSGITSGGNNNNNNGNNNGNNWGNNNQGNNNQGNNNSGNATVLQCENMTKSGQYTGNVGNPFNGVALYANDDAVSASWNATAGNYDFTLRGASDGNSTAKVDLVIGGQTKGTFSFSGTQATDATIKNVYCNSGNQTVRLVVTTDDGSWDCYADSLTITAAGGNNNNNNNNNDWNNNQGNNNPGNNNQGNNNQGNSNPGNNNSGTGNATVLQCENMTKSGQYTGNVSNPFNGVALYANDDAVSASWNATAGAYKFTLRGASNGNNTAKVDLVIDGQTKGTFSFTGTQATDAVIENVYCNAGNQTVRLVVTTDDGSWDFYADSLTITAVSGNNNNNNNDWNNNWNGNGNNNGNNSVAQSNQVQCESMTKSGQYTGNVNSPFSGVALYANNDKVSFEQYFANNTHSFTLCGAASGSGTARVDLVINGETKGSFYFTSQNPTEVTLQNVTHATGNVTVELVVTTDDGNWDAYIDYLKF